jgi:hypothetical protein
MSNNDNNHNKNKQQRQAPRNKPRGSNDRDDRVEEISRPDLGTSSVGQMALQQPMPNFGMGRAMLIELPNSQILTLAQSPFTFSHPQPTGMMQSVHTSAPGAGFTQGFQGLNIKQDAGAFQNRAIKVATGATRSSKPQGKGNSQKSVETSGKAPRPQRPVCPKCGSNEKVHCHNCCGSHFLSQCMGPLDEYGMIPGCFFCGTLDHRTEGCSNHDHSKLEQLARIMLEERMNRPMFHCSIAPNEHQAAQEGGKYYTCRPWSADFALAYEQQNPQYWKDFKYNRNASQDEVLTVDNSWNNPSQHKTPNKDPRAPSEKFYAYRTYFPPGQSRKRGRENELVDAASNKRLDEGETWDRRESRGMMRYLELYEKGEENKDAKQKGSRCDNCYIYGDHKTQDCRWACGSCGGRDHKKWDCPNFRSACTCHRHSPGHLMDECPIMCTQAFCDEEHQRGQHRAVNCSQCCVCGRIGHWWSDRCPEWNSGVTCGAGCRSHFSFQHDLWREGKTGPRAEMSSRCRSGCPRYFCDVHCQKCLMKTTEVDRHEPCVAIIEQHVQCGREGHNCVKFGQSCKECFPDGELDKEEA